MDFKRGRKALVVIGMHRSGTSMASGIFNILGWYLGSSVIPPLDENEKGFFENIPINQLNDRLLGYLGSSWHETYLFRKEWAIQNQLAGFTQELTGIFAQQFPESDHLLLKDPRLSVLLPLYLEVFKTLEILPYFIICVRNPSEVAASLENRNYFSGEKSVLVWMDYMLNAEFHTRAYPRSFTFFNDLVQDPFLLIREVSRNFHSDLNLTPALESKIRSFVERDLKHHNYSDIPSDSLFVPEIPELYHLFSRAKEGKFTPVDKEGIDNLSASFYNRLNFFQGIGPGIEASLLVVQDTRIKNVISRSVLSGRNNIVFDLSVFKGITAIKFAPANCRVVFMVHHIKLLGISGNTFAFDEFATGDDFYKTRYKKHKTNEKLYFPDEIPEITFNMAGLPTELAGIEFEITYYSFAEGALNLTVASNTQLIGSFYHEREALNDRLNTAGRQVEDCGEKLGKQENELKFLKDKHREYAEEIRVQQEELLSREKRVQELSNSLTWKTGRLVLGPVIFLYGLVQKLFIPKK